MGIIKVFVCGDIINAYSDQQFISDTIMSIIRSADYSVCNFEGITQFDGRKSHRMLQKPTTIHSLKNAGFNLLLLANNHILDYGEKGLYNTIQEIDKNSLHHTGAGFGYTSAYHPHIIEIKGKKFGFFNFCEAQNGFYYSKNQVCGYAWMGALDIPLTIKRLRNQVDYLIVLPHAGLEHYELPLPQFRELYRSYVDLGADCVIASHPHIAQGIEEYKGHFISYSLGNFFFPHSEKADSTDYENCSFSLMLSFDDSNGISYEPVFHSMDNLIVHLDDSHKVDLERLCNELLYSNYKDKITIQNTKVYNNKVRRLLCSSLMGTEANDSFKHKLNFIFNYLFNSNTHYVESETSRRKTLKHVILNETYRFIIQNEL